MKKIRVLLVMPFSPVSGGIASVSNHIFSFFKSHPGRFELMVCNTSHRYRPSTSRSLIIRMVTGMSNSLAGYFRVKKLIREQFPDVIHLASSSSLSLIKDSLIADAARHAKIPLIIHWHFGRIPELYKKQNWEWKKLLKVVNKSARSIVIDQKSLDTLVAAGCTNVVYIPNPLSLYVEEMACRLLSSPETRQEGRIIFVGNIIPAKGVFDLVKACAQLPAVTELLFVGPYKRNVKNKMIRIAEKRKNGDWLKFQGRLNMGRVLETMSCSPVLVLPSYTEGFPMVVLEAMAMGCAIVATEVGAIPEMLGTETENPCGIGIPPGNIEKLAQAIRMLLENPRMTTEMGTRGVKKVLAAYNADRIVSQYQLNWEMLADNPFGTSCCMY